MNRDSNGTWAGSLSRWRLALGIHEAHRDRAPCLQQKLHEYCGLWLLNQCVRQLVGIVAGTGRADLGEKRAAFRNRFAMEDEFGSFDVSGVI